MDFSIKCVLIVLITLGSSSVWSMDDINIIDKGYRTLYRIYEDCQSRNNGLTPCLKKKAINFFERIQNIENLSIAENFDLVRTSSNVKNVNTTMDNNDLDVEMAMGRNSGSTMDEKLNDVLYNRVANLLNGFDVRIRLPKTTSGELKRSMEEGRGKMKKMMGMMMMGMAMKMAALVPLAMGVLFLLAGKALIISKIALVLSLIIGLKKLLSQKQGGDSHHGGWQSGGGGGGGGWDRSLKNSGINDFVKQHSDNDYAQNMAYSGHRNNQ